jgi:glutamate 5-kinase
MRILIKIGSRVISREGKKLGIEKSVLFHIASQVSELQKKGHEVAIVTSGAVASCLNEKLPKNLRAAVGQPKLMREYSKAFDVFGTEICQLLYTHEDLAGKRSAYTKKLINEALAKKIVPIVNANDGASSEELDALKEFADNDILATKLARMIEADLVLILINEPGLVDYKNKSIVHQPKSIREAMKLVKGKSDLGTGGMKSKIEMAGVLLKSGIETRFLPGKEKDSIIRSVSGEKIGTIFAKNNPNANSKKKE